MVDMSATLLHHGHIRIIKEAAKHGKVIIALTSDEEIIKFQLDLENEFHEYSNVGQEFQKTFQEIVMLLQGLQGFQN